IVRAHVIYNGFVDLLFEYLKVNSTLKGKSLETMIKEFIFYWNTSITRFDIICWTLLSLFEEGEGSGSYHLKSEGMSFQIIDINDGKSLIPHYIEKGIKGYFSLPMILERKDPRDREGKFTLNGTFMDEPFEYLKPSIFFDMMGWKCEGKSFKSISSELLSLMNEKEKLRDTGYLIGKLFSDL
ncbi:MAG: hypothetical protein WB392_05765, partial [Methanotrichaceae archaeon]